jgi:hypothetical protein
VKHERLALIALCVMLLVIVGSVTAQDSLQSTALSFVADTYGVSADNLVVDYKLTTEVPAMGTVTQYKMSDSSTGAVYGAVINEKGQAWTPEEFRAAADAAYLEQYGKMDLQLFRRFEEDPSAVIPVEIWLVVDDSLFAGLRGPDYVGHGLGLNAEPPAPAELQGDGAAPAASPEIAEDPGVLAAREALNAQVDNLQAAVAARLADKGIEVRTVPQAPILAATLSREQVLEVANDSDVGRIFADDIQNQDMNSSAQNTHRASAVWGRGYTGVGAKVALVEDSRAYPNFWFYNGLTTRVPADPNMDNHATETMGNIASSHGLFLGMARNATMYSANATTYSTANLQAAANWAVSQGADIINNSWGPTTPSGCLSSLGMFFDYLVLVNARLVTFSAGNSGDLIGDHSMAYNVLDVGSFSDRNNASWWDDTMSSFSAWREGTTCSPSNGDREEPDLVAVGQLIRSTRIHPPSIDTSQVQGTSYSAPMVAGEAALLLEKNPNLRGKPEAMRAILMASAVHNLEGAARLSEYDGAGGIDAYSAYLDVNNGWWAQMTINPSTWTSYDFTFSAYAGEPISCVATWTSHPNATYTSDPLLSDIDLRLLNPSGTTVKTSSSVGNNFEIVRTTAGANGTWTCRVYKYSSSTTYEYLGIAVDRAFQYPYDYPY